MSISQHGSGEDPQCCPGCGSLDPMFARNIYRKGEFWGVCSDPYHPTGAGSPGKPASGSGGPT